jgi:Acetyltransferase (GNAT) domain
MCVALTPLGRRDAMILTKHMTWSFHPALDTFHQLRDRWDALNLAQNNHVLLDSGFIAALLRHFGSRDVILGINEDKGNPAMALMERKAPGVWETFQPSCAPLGPILYGAGEGGAENLVSLMRSLPGYALQLGILQQDPDCSGFSAVSGYDWIEKLDYIQTARISLGGTFQEYWAGREDRLRKNNDRLRRRMAEKGLRLDFTVVRDPADVEEGIRDLGRLESKGWKAKEGTAVSADNAQGRFYQALLEDFCARGEGVIYQLRIDDHVVATDICVARGEMLVLLKTAYDEDRSIYSPAFLLREDIVRDLYSGGRIRTYEFYGPLMEYQLRWTRNIRTLYHLTCFRHRWVRSARNFAKRIRNHQPTPHFSASPELE